MIRQMVSEQQWLAFLHSPGQCSREMLAYTESVYDSEKASLAAMGPSTLHSASAQDSVE